MSTRLILAVSALLLTASAAVAADAPAAPAAPPTHVAGVTITGGPQPKIYLSYPAEGSTVPAGVLVLKVIFDQAMSADNWSYAKTAGAAFPSCLGKPRMLADQRTFVLLCTIAANQSYALQINAAGAFKNADGRSAAPLVLHFAAGDPGVFYMQDALTNAGVASTDAPIMRWPDPDAGKTTLAGQPAN
jgi:hypothetical protein